MFGFKKFFNSYKKELKNIIDLEKQRILNELETGYYETNKERSIWDKDFNTLESKIGNVDLDNIVHKRLLKYLNLLEKGSLEELKQAVLAERKLEQQRIKNEKEYGYYESDEEIEINEEPTKKPSRNYGNQTENNKLAEERILNYRETGYHETDKERSQREEYLKSEKEKSDQLRTIKEQAAQEKKVNEHKTAKEKLEKEINYTETGYFETNFEREAREDQEIINNNKNFTGNRTNDQFTNLFQKYNIDLNFSKKRLLEKQINGELPIEELPVELRDNQRNELKKLNEIGVWYHIGQRRLVKFPKTDDEWEKITGRKLRNNNSGYSYFDGTRGFDDWASK